MYGEPLPEPRYWKALVAASVIALPVTAIIGGVLHWKLMAWIAVFAIAALGGSTLIHHRVRNDWRSAGHLKLDTLSRRSNRPRSR